MNCQAASATGQAVVARVTSVPHLDEQGNVLGLVVLSLDITEQRRAEKELRIQQEKLDLILDNLPALCRLHGFGLEHPARQPPLGRMVGVFQESKSWARSMKEVARPGSYRADRTLPSAGYGQPADRDPRDSRP